MEQLGFESTPIMVGSLAAMFGLNLESTFAWWQERETLEVHVSLHWTRADIAAAGGFTVVYTL